MEGLGENFYIEIKRTSKKTNVNQHQLFKAIIMKTVEHTGMEYNEVQKALYDNCGLKEFQEIPERGVVVNIIKIEDMDYNTFNQFIEACKLFVNDFFGFRF